MKFVHVTDLHLVDPFEELWGLNPYKRLDACLSDIETYHGDAEFCVISGDLADRGEREAYVALRKRLEAFAIPTYLMIGNHDDRPAFVKAFPEAYLDERGFVQFERHAGGAVFLFLDTFKGEGSAGAYCEGRREWLKARLEAAGDTPVVIFMHHPPFDIEIPYMDRIKLEDPDLFEEALGRKERIRHIFFGHVHRPVFVNWKGVSCTALPATGHQVPLNRDSVGTRYSDEPPMYAVVHLFDDRVVVNADCYMHRADCKMPPNKR